MQPRTGVRATPDSTYSVAIAAYNASTTVARAVESAWGQTLVPSEVIVVDDASADDTSAVAAAAGARVVRRRSNGGPAAAKNSAVLAASGEWVVVLDSDDYWLPERLAMIDRLVRADPQLDIVTTDAFLEFAGVRGRRYYGGAQGAVWPVGDQRAAILHSNFLFSHAAVRRDVWLSVGGCDESLVTESEDWPFWARLIYNGHQAGLVTEPLAVYTVREGSFSDHVLSGVGTYRAAMEVVATHPLATATERQMALANVAKARREEEWQHLREAVWGSTVRRSSALRLALDSDLPLRRRAKAMLTAVSPRLANSYMVSDPGSARRA